MGHEFFVHLDTTQGHYLITVKNPRTGHEIRTTCNALHPDEMIKTCIEELYQGEPFILSFKIYEGEYNGGQKK
jgi:hypothetical protein